MNHTANHPNRRLGRQLGLSLVEASVAMAIMGVAATMIWQVTQGNQSRTLSVENQEKLRRAEAGVLTFIALEGRLPCPSVGVPYDFPLEQSQILVDGIWVPVKPRCMDDATAPLERNYLPPARTGFADRSLERIRYKPFDSTALPPRLFVTNQFRVLLNDLAIEAQGSAPRAQPTALNDVAAEKTYDGILDVCEVMGQLSQARMSAFTLGVEMADPKDIYRHEVSAAKVYEFLSCPSQVALARSQFNAHLASATLNKSMKEYKWIFESDYGAYSLDLAEGAFWLSSKSWSELTNWAQTMQALSKFMGDRMINPQGMILMVSSLATKIATTMSVAAQAANVGRFATNLKAADARYRTILDLTARADKVYLDAYANAVLASSSAYFIKEQFEVPSRPRPRGDLVPQSLNPLAEEMLKMARKRALDYGVSDVASAITALPKPSDVPLGSSMNFKADTEDLSALGVRAVVPDVTALLSEEANAKSAEAATAGLDLSMKVDPDAERPKEEDLRADKDGKGKALQDSLTKGAEREVEKRLKGRLP